MKAASKRMKKLLWLTLIVFTFNFVVSAQQTDVKILIKNADDFSIDNDLPSAIAEISKAIKLEPKNAALYLKRGEYYFGLPDYKLVLQDMKKAAALDPDNKYTILTAARYLRNIRECSESLNILNDFINTHPESDDLIYNRAHSKMCASDWLGAYEDISRAVRLSPGNTHYQTLQFSLLSKIGYKEISADQFARLLTMLVNNYENAEEKYGRDDIGRQIAELLQARAATHHANKDEIAEFADLEQAVKYHPKDFTYRHRARIFAEHDMFDKAVEDYTAAIKLSPKDVLFLIERGDIYAEWGKLSEALADYDASLKLEPSLKDVVYAKKKYAAETLKKK